MAMYDLNKMVAAVKTTPAVVWVLLGVWATVFLLIWIDGR